MLSEKQKWYRVSLRLIGDTLPIEELEAKLGLGPSTIGIKGKYRRDNPRYSKYETNLWVSKCLMDSDVPFEQQIAAMLDMLEPRNAALREVLSLPGVEGELFLGFSSGNGQGGAFFSGEILKRIAECGLSLTLDLYPPDIDEKERV